ncbi:hypothetical protein M406DRAFT_51972, partial [Cryphonectria parasitica EP155]
LPPSPHGSILITTRTKKVARRLTGDYKNIIKVPPMDKGHALALLMRKTGSQPDIENGAALVEALEYMPLAISQAAAYIQQRAPRTSIGKYLEEFRKSERQKVSLLNWDEESLRRDCNASNSVIQTWQISFDAIRSEQPSAADLLSLMSFFDRQGIPESLVRPPANIVTAQRFEDNLAMLRNYCLISLNKTGDVFEMHNLVQLATRKWLSVYERTEMFKEQFISRIAHEFPTGDYSNWATCQTLFAHVEGAIHHRPKGEKQLEEWAQVLYNGSWYARGQGRYSLAETMAKKSRDARIETLGDQHELTWHSISMVGTIFRDQGRYKKAEKLDVEVMEMSKQKLGPAHLDTLTSMASLAFTWHSQESTANAIDLMNSCVQLRRQVLGPEHPDTSSSIKTLNTWRAE